LGWGKALYRGKLSDIFNLNPDGPSFQQLHQTPRLLCHHYFIFETFLYDYAVKVKGLVQIQMTRNDLCQYSSQFNTSKTAARNVFALSYHYQSIPTCSMHLCTLYLLSCGIMSMAVYFEIALKKYRNQQKWRCMHCLENYCFRNCIVF